MSREKKTAILRSFFLLFFVRHLITKFAPGNFSRCTLVWKKKKEKNLTKKSTLAPLLNLINNIILLISVATAVWVG